VQELHVAEMHPVEECGIAVAVKVISLLRALAGVLKKRNPALGEVWQPDGSVDRASVTIGASQDKGRIVVPLYTEKHRGRSMLAEGRRVEALYLVGFVVASPYPMCDFFVDWRGEMVYRPACEAIDKSNPARLFQVSNLALGGGRMGTQLESEDVTRR
jgi:hypothetical protein